MITKRRFKYFVLIHLLFLVTITFISTIGAYEKSTSYVKNGTTDNLLTIKSGLREVVSLPLIGQYLSIAGIEAGYGFFAPNVASSYLLKISIREKESGKVVEETFYPPFKTREGRNRYHTLLGSFQDRLTILENEREKKKSDLFRESKKFGDYLDIYIKSIGRYYYKQYPMDSHSVVCTLFLYDYPSLTNAIEGNTQPSLINLIDINANPRKTNIE